MKSSWKIIILLLLLLVGSSADGKEIMRYKRFSTSDGLSHRVIGNMLQDSAGYIWMSTWNGVCRFDGKHFVSYNNLADSTKIGRIFHIYDIGDGRLVYSNHNLENFILDPKKSTSVPADSSISTLPIARVKYKNLIDSIGLLIVRNSEEFRIPYQETMLTSNSHYHAFVDRQDIFWASFDDALYQIYFTESPYEHITHVDGEDSPLYGDEIRSIAPLPDHRLLLGARNNYLYLYDSLQNFLGYIDAKGHINSRPTKFDARVYRMVVSPDNTIWMGTRGQGLMRLSVDGNGFSIQNWTTENSSLPYDHIYDIAELSDRRLLISTWGGGMAMLKVDDNGLRVLHHMTSPYRSRCVKQLSNGHIAFGTTMGLYIVNQSMEEVQTFKDMDVSCIFEASNGVIYISTMGMGLYTLETSPNATEGNRYSLQPFDLNENVDFTLSIFQPADQSLWFITDHNLIRYDINDGSVLHLDKNNFGEKIVFGECRPFLWGDRLWLGTSRGRFLLYHDSKSDFCPNLVVDVPDTTVIHWGDVFVAHPNAFDYRLPRNIHYAFRMASDSAWTQLDPATEEIRIESLKPGKHRIVVRSTDARGVWTNNNHEVLIDVQFVIWQKCVIFIIVIILLGIFVLIYRFFMNRKRTNDESKKAMELAVEKAIEKTMEKVMKHKDKLTLNVVPSAPEISDHDQEFLNQTSFIIEKHIDDPDYNIDNIADDLHVSRTVLYQRFKEILNTTPAAFVTEFRLKRAMQLLKSGQYRVNEVSLMTGFSDAKYFARIFKQKVGMSPTKYVEENASADNGDSTSEDGEATS